MLPALFAVPAILLSAAIFILALLAVFTRDSERSKRAFRVLGMILRMKQQEQLPPGQDGPAP
jgi:hypothetical protein